MRRRSALLALLLAVAATAIAACAWWYFDPDRTKPPEPHGAGDGELEPFPFIDPGAPGRLPF